MLARESFLAVLVATFCGMSGTAKAATLIGVFEENAFFSDGNGVCTICEITGDDDLFLSAKIEEDLSREGPEASFYSISFDGGNQSGLWSNQGAPNDPIFFVVKASDGFALYAVEDPSGEDWTTSGILNGGQQTPAMSYVAFYAVPEVSTIVMIVLGLALLVSLELRGSGRA